MPKYPVLSPLKYGDITVVPGGDGDPIELSAAAAKRISQDAPGTLGDAVNEKPAGKDKTPAG